MPAIKAISADTSVDQCEKTWPECREAAAHAPAFPEGGFPTHIMFAVMQQDQDIP